MIYTTAYEILPRYFTWFFIIPLIAIVISIFLMKLAFFTKFDENSSVITIRIILTGFTIVLLAISSLLPYGKIRSNNTIYKDYINGKYQIYTVEGLVSQFHPEPLSGHDTEHFYVENVYFEYSTGTTLPQPKTKVHGGQITGDGQNVRITYISYNSSALIVKLEILGDKQ